jgi:dihydropteroate synthase
MAALQIGRFSFTLDRPLIMGVVNVTPDSFSDGGRHATTEQAVAHAHCLIQEGADILDIGGESTRPGAPAVGLEQEWERVGPVLAALQQAGVALSVDTRKPQIMRRALQLGCDMINDVSGFTDPDSIDAVAGATCACCIMHMQGDPLTMQVSPDYRDVLSELRLYFYTRVKALSEAGVGMNRIVLDPGIGFGKSVQHNLAVLRQLRSMHETLPWLVGVSRKSLIGHLTGRDVQDRLAGSLGGAIAAWAAGASILRVHDVAATKDALAVYSAVIKES